MTLERKFGSLSIWFFNSWHKVKWAFFLVLCEQAGNKLHSNESHVQIHGQNPLTGTPTHTCSFWDLINCVPMILVDFFSNFFSTFSLVWLVDGRSEWGWSSTHISPLLNCTNHLKTCVRLSASSLKALWSISSASVAVFPGWKQNLKQIRCRYGHTSQFHNRSLTTLRRIDNTSLYNLLRRCPSGYWLVMGATTLT